MRSAVVNHLNSGISVVIFGYAMSDRVKGFDIFTASIMWALGVFFIGTVISLLLSRS